jgi:hypothetical protein
VLSGGRLLPYARQVLELEKIAALEGREPLRPPRESLRPLATTRAAVCVVCQRAAANACARCGAVSYCTPEHQWVDATWHEVVCERLCEIREDAELLRHTSKGEITRRLLAHRTERTSVEPASCWDEYFSPATKLAPAERRIGSDLASRPLTLSRVLVSPELSLLAGAHDTLRIHMMAASEKELEAPALYSELHAVLPTLRIELSFIGPELPPRPLDAITGIQFSLCATTYRQRCWSDLGRPHLIVGFNPGLLLYPTWKDTLLELRGSQVPLVITSYRSWEAHAEAELLASLGAVVVQPPSANPFQSLAWRRSSTIANDLSRDNACVGVFRL